MFPDKKFGNQPCVGRVIACFGDWLETYDVPQPIALSHGNGDKEATRQKKNPFEPCKGFPSCSLPKIKARGLLLVWTAVKAATLHPSILIIPGDAMESVTSGCFKDPAAAVYHGARHDESVKPQFVAGEHRFNPHGGRLLAQPVQGIQTWEKGRRREKKNQR